MFKYDETGAVVPLSKTPPKEIKRDFCGNPSEDVPEVTTTPDEEEQS